MNYMPTFMPPESNYPTPMPSREDLSPEIKISEIVGRMEPKPPTRPRSNGGTPGPRMDRGRKLGLRARQWQDTVGAFTPGWRKNFSGGKLDYSKLFAPGAPGAIDPSMVGKIPTPWGLIDATQAMNPAGNNMQYTSWAPDRGTNQVMQQPIARKRIDAANAFGGVSRIG